MEISTESSEDLCRFVALPGVPSEMKLMFRNSVAPTLAGTGVVIRQALVNCFGAGESTIEEILGDLTARGREPEVGITASDATITLRIVARGATPENCELAIGETRCSIVEKLGDLVFGFENEQLPDVVVAALQAREATVSVAEIFTAGRVSEWLHARDEAGEWVRGGLVLGNEQTPGHLVPASAMASAASLADHCRSMFETDYAIAVGASSGSVVRVAVSSASETTTNEITVVGNPAIRHSRIAKTAINDLRLRLLRSQSGLISDSRP